MGLGGNEPIRQREFDRYVQDADRRFEALERYREAHEKAHDEDDDNERDDRRWSWQQIVAWVGVAAVLAAAWVQAAATAK